LEPLVTKRPDDASTAEDRDNALTTLTACSGVLPEKPLVPHLVKKFTAFYGAKDYYRVPKSLPRLPTLSETNSVHIFHAISLRRVLILSSRLHPLKISMRFFQLPFTKNGLRPLSDIARTGYQQFAALMWHEGSL
jgi:hypothetical protein